MLKHYSHIRMEAKWTALESIVAKKTDTRPAEDRWRSPLKAGVMGNSDVVPTVHRVN
jgi:hypothetical protein